MEEVGHMNIFSALFGIFRQRGLVEAIRENRPPGRFIFWALLFSVAGGALYGLAMGIGITPETAVKDGLKVALLVLLGFALSVPFFFLAYRLMGREESSGKVVLVPLTLVLSVTLILAVTAPLVFLLSLLAGFSHEAVYLHIVIVDVALLVGLYLAGTLVFHAFPEDRGRLVVPNVAGFLMMVVVLVVLILFFRPFLDSTSTFSYGTDLLKDRLGIGVQDKVLRALKSAATAERLSYRFQDTNDNGDLLRDATIHRAGDDYYLEIHLYAEPGSPVLKERHAWILRQAAYDDFNEGLIARTTPEKVKAILKPALPPEPFSPGSQWGGARWRAFEREGLFTATCLTADRQEVSVGLEDTSLRLKEMTRGEAGPGIHRESRLLEVSPGTLDRDSMEAELDRAILRSSVDVADASLESYLQDQAFFSVSYPRTWHPGSWDGTRRQVRFSADAPDTPGSASLEVQVYDPVKARDLKRQAGELAGRFRLQPAYRQVSFELVNLKGQPAARLEYLLDRTAKGKMETSRHWEYMFPGKRGRYHLNFSAPSGDFDSYKPLFESLAANFKYV
ncbi:MAG: hypothetical protein V2A78_03145 [bacterium]